MDDAEIERLRKVIRKTYASQPHKIKCWLAVLEMQSSAAAEADSADDPKRVERAAVTSLRASRRPLPR